MLGCCGLRGVSSRGGRPLRRSPARAPHDALLRRRGALAAGAAAVGAEPVDGLVVADAGGAQVRAVHLLRLAVLRLARLRPRRRHQLVLPARAGGGGRGGGGRGGRGVLRALRGGLDAAAVADGGVGGDADGEYGAGNGWKNVAGGEG